jgi:hypothetical protein
VREWSGCREFKRSSVPWCGNFCCACKKRKLCEWVRGEWKHVNLIMKSVSRENFCGFLNCAWKCCDGFVVINKKKTTLGLIWFKRYGSIKLYRWNKTQWWWWCNVYQTNWCHKRHKLCIYWNAERHEINLNATWILQSNLAHSFLHTDIAMFSGNLSRVPFLEMGKMQQKLIKIYLFYSLSLSILARRGNW